MQTRSAKLVSLSDQVYEYLRLGIISGEVAQGEKLVEMDIAAQVGTSQGPVREALQRLERDGLVERRARSATFATNISMDEMYELFAVRSTIEGFAVRRTSQKITDEQCDELEDLIDEMAEAGREQKLMTLAQYDMQFHSRIVEWSQSAGLLRVWTPLSSQIQRFIVQSHPLHYSDFVEIGTRHQPILDALRNHDSEAAFQAIQGHVMHIWSRINP